MFKVEQLNMNKKRSFSYLKEKLKTLQNLLRNCKVMVSTVNFVLKNITQFVIHFCQKQVRCKVTKIILQVQRNTDLLRSILNLMLENTSQFFFVRF
jgi:hypothetical protein